MIAIFKRRDRPRRRPPDPYITLRATVEASCKIPAIVLVSSVAPNDGKTTVSAGLATALAKAGSSTLTVDGEKMCKKSRVDVERIFAELRERHDFIVIDGCTLADGALTLASLADGVLMAVRSGRKAVEADGEAAIVLERFGANFIGVVETIVHGGPPALEATEVQSIARGAIAESLAS
jgi:Mrp family chromosome partitioning ATPase